MEVIWQFTPPIGKKLHNCLRGIVGSVSNIDPDKVYDYHTASDIHPTEVVFNVILMQIKKIYETLLSTETVTIVLQ